MPKRASFVPCYHLSRSQWIPSHLRKLQHDDIRPYLTRTPVHRVQAGRALVMMDGSLEPWEMESDLKELEIDVDRDDDTTELDDILGPDAPLEAVIEQNRRLFSDDKSWEALEGTEEVTLDKPLGVIMEELPNGQVFIDEVVPDGNAHKSGVLHEGDIIVAVSLPFGSGLTPVPTENALDSIENLMNTREGNSVTIVVRHSADVAQLRAQIEVPIESDYTPEQLEQLCQAIRTEWYPLAAEDDNTPTDMETKIAELRDHGYNMDVDIPYDPSPEELLEAQSVEDEIRRPGDEEYDPQEDEMLQYWRKLYEQGKKAQS